MSRGLQLCVAGLMAALALLPATARAEDAKEVKPIATAKSDSRDARIGPIDVKRAGVVIRSAEELVASSNKPKAAKDPDIQKETEAELVKLLKVEKMDWSKQMVLAARGEPGTKADRVRFDSLTAEAKTLTVAWRVSPRPPHAGPGTPIALILIERFDGDVKFVPSEAK